MIQNLFENKNIAATTTTTITTKTRKNTKKDIQRIESFSVHFELALKNHTFNNFRNRSSN